MSYPCMHGHISIMFKSCCRLTILFVQKEKGQRRKTMERGKVCGMLLAAHAFIIYEELGKYKYSSTY